MELNRWSEKHVYYTLTGVAMIRVDPPSGEALAGQGRCAQPESIADFRP